MDRHMMCLNYCNFLPLNVWLDNDTFNNIPRKVSKPRYVGVHSFLECPRCHLPTRWVEYPAFLSTSAIVTSLSGRHTSHCGLRTVKIPVRLCGSQNKDVETRNKQGRKYKHIEIVGLLSNRGPKQITKLNSKKTRISQMRQKDGNNKYRKRRNLSIVSDVLPGPVQI